MTSQLSSIQAIEPQRQELSAPPKGSETADKIHAFFTRLEGGLTVFAILAGTAVAILWSVPLGLLGAGIGIVVSLALFSYNSSKNTQETLPTGTPTLRPAEAQTSEVSRESLGLVNSGELQSGSDLNDPGKIDIASISTASDRSRMGRYDGSPNSLNLTVRGIEPPVIPVIAPVEATPPKNSAVQDETNDVEPSASPVLDTLLLHSAPTFTAAKNREIFNETMLYINEHYADETTELVQNTAVKDRSFPPSGFGKHLLFDTENPPFPDMHVYVTNTSTLRAVQDLVTRGLRPLVLNMAYLFTMEEKRCEHNGQEPTLWRQSNLICSLMEMDKKGWHPWPEHGGILSQRVQFFRADPSDNYAFLEEPFQADVFTMAAYICGKDPGNRMGIGFRPESDEEYLAGTEKQIKTYLRTALMNMNLSIVAGAFGCGASANDPALIAGLFKEILQDPEFKGQFQEVVFAIVEDLHSQGKNYNTFKQILES